MENFKNIFEKCLLRYIDFNNYEVEFWKLKLMKYAYNILIRMNYFLKSLLKTDFKITRSVRVLKKWSTWLEKLDPLNPRLACSWSYPPTWPAEHKGIPQQRSKNFFLFLRGFIEKIRSFWCKTYFLWVWA